MTRYEELPQSLDILKYHLMTTNLGIRIVLADTILV